jgi:hypothetical protein
MKNSLSIGGVVLALVVQGSSLLAQDVRWRSVDNPPPTEEGAVTLDRPVALKAPPAAAVPAIAPGGIVPARFEVPAAPEDRSVVLHAVAKPNSRPGPEIIAVSSPIVTPVTPPSPAEEEEESLFAVDRPLRTISSTRRAGSGSVLQTAARTSTPPAAGAMLPPWDTPADTSWSGSSPANLTVRQPNLPAGDGPMMVDGEDPFAAPPINPLMGRRFYIGGEYLLWWLQGQQVPVLATTSNPSDAGILGAPSTTVLFGGNGINSGPFSGGRFWAGYWLDCNATKGIEIVGFFLGQRSANFSANSITTPVIARPFLEANNGQEFAQLTALPGVTAGSLTINAPTSLWGLGGNYVCALCCGCNYRLTSLIGFRNINLDEKLTITENVQGLPTAPAPFTNETITVVDSFRTQNHFYGGNIGLGALWYWGRWSVNARAQVALGDTVQILDINGSQRFVSPTGVVQNFTGGLLALPSNIGHFTNNAFSVVPEASINVGYQILPSVRAFVGYNFLYWSNVIRPGTSIDRSLDVTQIPNFRLNPEPQPVPGLHPAPMFHEVGFWAQGLTFGLQFTY